MAIKLESIKKFRIKIDNKNFLFSWGDQMIGEANYKIQEYNMLCQAQVVLRSNSKWKKYLHPIHIPG